MAEILVLEFDGVTREQYDSVNKVLGLNMQSGEGDWPAGMTSHIGGADADGHFIVVEGWNSVAEQEAFMADRLGPALHDGGLPAPTSVRWFGAWGHFNS